MWTRPVRAGTVDASGSRGLPAGIGYGSVNNCSPLEILMPTRRSPAVLIAVLCMAGLVVAIMQTLIVPVLPDMPEVLGASANDASWLITATVLTGAVATPTMSRLADMYGKRRILVVALAALIFGSILGVVGTSLAMVVIGRAFQGFAFALVPVAISILRDELPRERLNIGVGLVSATVGIGAAVGVPLSGLVYAHLGWHALFWFSAGTGLAMLVCVLRYVPESPVRSGGRFDILGAALLSVALLALLLGVTKGASWGWTSAPIVACFASSAVLFAIWVPWQLHARDPVVDLRTTRRRAVLLTDATALLVGFAVYCNILTLTMYLQLPTDTGYAFGLSPQHASFYMLPSSAVMIVAAPLAASSIRRVGARAVLATSMTFIIVGFILRMTLTASAWQVGLGALVISAGTGAAYATMPILIMRSVPIAETAAANGLNAVLRYVGTGFASATVAMILTSVTIPSSADGLPDHSAFNDVYVLAIGSAILALAAALLLPRDRLRATHAETTGRTADVAMR
jgi:MFS family permease